ncbi:hypothetical protein J3L16_13475 [Alteromonas sp. 5E99-2]|uniref:hypothetical protein n=1 Tax=Alteromonas sp. 5E99-2 TaxID=2817683 RepID=UPI001A9813F0|nr:hypothetical protein [Alteromonas sp. 5E99-2]MBO1256697.1 hypothetical protein [Alteromonas sp. 5E99-2]
MSKIDKTKPDVLKVTEFILDKNKSGDSFSICEAAKTPELNGISDYRIAEIMRDICLQPNGPDSIELHTKIDGTFTHNLPAKWQLNPDTYFSYLSYQSVKQSEKANYIALAALVVAIIALFAAS